VLKEKGLVDPAVNAWHIRVLVRGLYSVLPDWPGGIEMLARLLVEAAATNRPVA